MFFYYCFLYINVFVAGWRHALRSEWPFIIINIISKCKINKCRQSGFGKPCSCTHSTAHSCTTQHSSNHHHPCIPRSSPPPHLPTLPVHTSSHTCPPHNSLHRPGMPTSLACTGPYNLNPSQHIPRPSPPPPRPCHPPQRRTLQTPPR